MNVWKMNLKDNRGEVPEELELSKFEFCKQRDIVGIGWAGYGNSEDNALTEKDHGYEKAKNSISSFVAGDLVWVKNPETKEYYLCKIKSHVKITEDDEFFKNDISMYCECEYKYIGTADKLPNEIKKEDLVSISTISKANEQVSTATLSLYNTEETKKSSKLTKAKLILNKIFKNILKYKWIYLSAALAISILLIITVTTVNSIHNKQEKRISESLANKTFVTDDFDIIKFNDKGEYDHTSAYLTDDKTEIKEFSSYSDSEDFYKYDVEITFFGQKFLLCNGKYKIKIDKNNNAVTFGNYYLIDEEKEKMLNDYYIKLEQKEKEEKEIEQIKSYIPNKNEFYERVLEVFPEVKNWQLFGNTEGLYMDPSNSKNLCNLGNMPILNFNNGNNKITFMKLENSISVSEQGGSKLTEERYKQLIKLAFGDAPDNLKICDLATFKKLTDTEGKAYPTKHSIEYKGITYEWSVGYKNGEYSNYLFAVRY